MLYLALDLRRKKRKPKTFERCCNSTSIYYSINILQQGESETLGAETLQRTEVQIFAGIWLVNLIDLIKKKKSTLKTRMKIMQFILHNFKLFFNFSAFHGV